MKDIKANIKIVLMLLVVVIIAVFAVQNSKVVTIRFFVWSVYISQALIIVLSAVFGIIAGLLLSISRSIEAGRNLKQAKKQVDDAGQDSILLKTQIEDLEKENSNLKEQLILLKPDNNFTENAETLSVNTENAEDLNIDKEQQ